MSGADDRRRQAQMEREWEADMRERPATPARALPQPGDPGFCAASRYNTHEFEKGRCRYCGQRKPVTP